MIYCRRCDLAFCERHADEHDGDDHALTEAPPAAVGCCICLGIYAPRRDDHSASRRVDVLVAEAPHLIAPPLEPGSHDA